MIEIRGLVEPKSETAARICREDLDEVIAAFMQDKGRDRDVQEFAPCHDSVSDEGVGVGRHVRPLRFRLVGVPHYRVRPGAARTQCVAGQAGEEVVRQTGGRKFPGGGAV